MLHLLTSTQYINVQEIFHSLAQTQPMCTSVLAGVYPGKVFVDNPTTPRSVLLTTFIESEAHGVWGFLAGEPNNAIFNRALNTAIFARQVVPAEAPVLFLTCTPDDWGGQMDAVLAPRPPIWMQRYHFISRQVRFDWRTALPQGFTVERIGADLHQFPNLQLPEDVAATLAKWQAMPDPRFADFGFVTVDCTGPQPVIASWATVDFIANGAGDLGFFTQPDYRRRSLGTIAVSAALEHGFTNGLKQVNWTCDADNPGSVRTAEKLGLERIDDYHMAVLIMDEQRHMAFFDTRSAG